jgi:hypothetical protein
VAGNARSVLEVGVVGAEDAGDVMASLELLRPSEDELTIRK